MELKILEKTKSRITFELEGTDNTFCGALKDELWNDESVSAATVIIEHPLKPIPKFLVEAADPVKALLEASARLQKKNSSLKL